MVFYVFIRSVLNSSHHVLNWKYRTLTIADRNTLQFWVSEYFVDEFCKGERQRGRKYFSLKGTSFQPQESAWLGQQALPSGLLKELISRHVYVHLSFPCILNKGRQKFWCWQFCNPLYGNTQMQLCKANTWPQVNYKIKPKYSFISSEMQIFN